MTSSRTRLSTAMVASGALLLAVGITALGWFAGRLEFAPRVRSGPRTPDSSNLRQIGQAALIWASENDGSLPPTHLDKAGETDTSSDATIYSVAAALARGGGLNYAPAWFCRSDPYVVPPRSPSERVLIPDTEAARTLDPDFAACPVISWDFVTGLDTSMPPTTPVAWTRGLREDGTWSSAGVHGTDGGYVVFLGGNVQFYASLRAAAMTAPDGTPTSNILETLPTSARVVGAGPGSLHGRRGLARAAELNAPPVQNRNR